MNNEFYNAANELKLKLGVCEKSEVSKEESLLFASLVKNGEELPPDIIEGDYPNEFSRIVPIYKTPEEHNDKQYGFYRRRYRYSRDKIEKDKEKLICKVHHRGKELATLCFANKYREKLCRKGERSELRDDTCISVRNSASCKESCEEGACY